MLRNDRTRLAVELLGSRCRCCGVTEAARPANWPENQRWLCFDHITPQSGKREKPWDIAKTVIATHGENCPIQLLCQPCNTWKNNGPACPCKWWDRIAPGWRDAVSWSRGGRHPKRKARLISPFAPSGSFAARGNSNPEFEVEQKARVRGRARADKLSSARRSEIAKFAAQTRWSGDDV